MTNFEQSIKDQADQFLIFPSKKIWRGLYNNLHPGSTWPSFAMGLVFILTLVSIGHLNSPESRRANRASQTTIGNLSENVNNQNNRGSSLNTEDKNIINPSYWSNQFRFWTSGPSYDNALKNKKLIADNLSNNSMEGFALKKYNANPLDLISKSNKYTPNRDNSESFNHFPPAKQVNFIYTINKNETSDSNKVNQETFNNKEPQTNFNHNKEEGKITWTYYITPSISTGDFPGITNNESPTDNSSGSMSKGNNFAINYNSQIGFETGTQVAFRFDEKWQFITGASLLYSGYQMSSNPIIPDNPDLSLHAGNQNNLSSINNYKLQASIPFGVQYELWKNNDIQIKISSTIEPSFLITSDIYTLSPDGKSYVNSPDLLRRVNLSGNIGSYISFGTKNIKWQIGPTVRYHILSNFKNGTSSGDHLIDYGIRIGISK
jgi:hypothetical protein